MTSKEQPIIKIEKVSKVFNPGKNEVRAVDGISFEVYSGEFIALMGSSGSGKSTLLNILGCLDEPSAGQYYLNGKDISKLNADELAAIRNQTFGFIFQSYNLLQRTTALENVTLPLLYSSSFSRSERKPMALKALEEVGLEDRVKHKTNELSGGQQQRVAIARALINNPLIIFADEATGNLDTKTSYQIMRLLQDLNSKGKTIIMVTHEDDIAAFCKRKIELKDGKIIGDDKINHPRNIN